MTKKTLREKIIEILTILDGGLERGVSPEIIKCTNEILKLVRKELLKERNENAEKPFGKDKK